MGSCNNQSINRQLYLSGCKSNCTRNTPSDSSSLRTPLDPEPRQATDPVGRSGNAYIPSRYDMSESDDGDFTDEISFDGRLHPSDQPTSDAEPISSGSDDGPKSSSSICNKESLSDNGAPLSDGGDWAKQHNLDPVVLPDKGGSRGNKYLFSRKGNGNSIPIQRVYGKFKANPTGRGFFVARCTCDKHVALTINQLKAFSEGTLRVKTEDYADPMPTKAGLERLYEKDYHPWNDMVRVGKDGHCNGGGVDLKLRHLAETIRQHQNCEWPEKLKNSGWYSKKNNGS